MYKVYVDTFKRRSHNIAARARQFCSNDFRIW